MASKKTKAVPAAAENVTAAPAAEATTTTTVEPVQLTIADLQLLSRIVDLASRRGAFQANELTQVGETFDKLAAFLSYVEAAQAKDKAAEEAAAAPAAAEATTLAAE